MTLIDAVNNSIYFFLAAVALLGAFMVILIMRRIAQKRFSSAAQARDFFDEIFDHLDRRDYDAVIAKCDSSPYWSKAAPQLIQLAVENRGLPGGKLRRLVAERFERDVLADLEYRTSWVGTAVKTAPMLGLLGTVLGMIAAFGKIAGASAQGVKPAQLASDISFALWTTAIGLFIAVPLVVAGNALTVRIAKLQDSVQEHLGDFLDRMTAVLSDDRRG